MKIINIFICLSVISTISSLLPNTVKIFPEIMNLANKPNCSKVYFTRNLTAQAIVDIYKKLNVKLEGNLGLKVHSGERNGRYFLRPTYLQKIYEYTKGTFIECNTAYSQGRNTTERHKETLQINGWYNKDRKFVIMDEDEEDNEIPIEGGKLLDKNHVGTHLRDFDSCLVLSHFKGHFKGGYGGALKQMSIGFASRGGKAYIHTGGYTTNHTIFHEHECSPFNFTTGMADAASSVVKYFRKKKGIAFINVIKDVSLYCDCGSTAPPPKINDIGILASTDPVAIDRASLDLVLGSGDEGVDELKEQIDRRTGENILKVCEELGVGYNNYELISIDGSSYFKYSLIMFGLILAILL